MQETKKWNVGDHCWFLWKCEDVVMEGTITSIPTDPACPYIEIKPVRRFAPNPCIIPPENIFDTQKQAKEKLKERIETRQDELAAEINDIPDLIRFLFSHTVCPCEEYTDWDARKVALKKAKEFEIDV